MKKLLFVCALFLIPITAKAQLALYQPGYRTIDGSQLNKMVNVVNGLTGNGGTASGGYFSKNTTGTTGPTPATGTVIQAVGANATTARIELDSYAGVPLFTAIRHDGTKAAPTAILSADQLGAINFHGSISSTTTYGPSSRVTSFATENWSGTAGGSKIVLSTTPNTTQTLTDAVTIDQDQSMTIVGAVKGPSFIANAPTGAGVGYTTGAGGIVTQATNRTTGVTLNTLTGSITTNNASLAAETAAAFTVTNSTVAITDTVVVSIRSGSNGGNTTVIVNTVTSGSFNLQVANQNASGGAAETGAIIINYAVIKGASS